MADPRAGIRRTVVPIEGLLGDGENTTNVLPPPAIHHPFLPKGDIIVFGRKDCGKTTLNITMLLKWGYKLHHIVYCCPHVSEEKLANPTSSQTKYLLLKENLDNLTFVGMETEDDPDEAFARLQEAFAALEEHKDGDKQMLLVLDDYTAFLCYNPIKTLMNSRWVNLKHLPAWGW